MDESRSRLRRYTNRAYDPWASRIDIRMHCSVCGWAGIDPEIQQEPEQAVFSIVQTGSIYQAPAGTAVEGLSVEDLRTEAVRPGGGTGCPLCGSPRVFDGSAPDLLRV